jgi:hypothetical protein
MQSHPFSCTVTECGVCKKLFFNKSKARRHVIQKCGGDLFQSTKLVHHHPCNGKRSVLFHQCTTCNYTTFQRTNILKHATKVHPNSPIISERRSFSAENIPESETPKNVTPADESAIAHISPGYIPKGSAETKMSKKEKRTGEYVYLVIDGKVRMKIGRWTNDLKDLRSRYATYYGNPSILVAEVDDSRAVEHILKKKVNDLKPPGPNKNRELSDYNEDIIKLFLTLTGSTRH